jgi:hypothetical protein
MAFYLTLNIDLVNLILNYLKQKYSYYILINANFSNILKLIVKQYPRKSIYLNTNAKNTFNSFQIMELLNVKYITKLKFVITELSCELVEKDCDRLNIKKYCHLKELTIVFHRGLLSIMNYTYNIPPELSLLKKLIVTNLCVYIPKTLSNLKIVGIKYESCAFTNHIKNYRISLDYPKEYQKFPHHKWKTLLLYYDTNPYLEDGKNLPISQLSNHLFNHQELLLWKEKLNEYNQYKQFNKKMNNIHKILNLVY